MKHTRRNGKGCLHPGPTIRGGSMSHKALVCECSACLPELATDAYARCLGDGQSPAGPATSPSAGVLVHLDSPCMFALP